MPWLFAAAAACVCFCAAAFGTFVPLRDAAGIEYLFAWSGAAILAARSSVALSALALLYLIVVRARRDMPAPPAAAQSGRWLAPLTGLACVPLGFLPAVPGVGKYGAPAAYFFYDLRWWWLALLAGWTLVRAEAASGAPVRAWSRRSAVFPLRGVLLEGLLVATVMVWAIATTPHLRFSGTLHGDEPKYLRYCEVWCQGGGFDISQKVGLRDVPPGTPPRLDRTFRGFLSASLEEVRALGSDLKRFVADPRRFRWNRVTGGDGFVSGKHGGIYQIYQPGLSAILFSGYLVDRYLLESNSGYNDEFPAELRMTNLVMLLTYGACAAALFRLLRKALGHDHLAWIWAAIGTMTLPTTAFAFQLYTELPAALIIIAVTSYVLFAPGSSSRTAIAAGAATAGLIWLHPRFLLVSLCLAAAGALGTGPLARRMFTGAFALVLLSVMAFDYRVTGSWLPTALWDTATPGGALSLSSIPLNLAAYVVDRRWGVIPPAVILIALFPGLAWLARRSPRAAALLAALALALGIPAAGHSLSAAGGTPGRLVLAIVPLAIWPIALLVRELWASVVVRVTAVILVVVSLDTGLAYNWSHQKHLGTIRDTSLSGWKLNLAFPGVRDELWASSRNNFMLFLAIVVVLLALAVLAYVYAGRPATGAPVPRRTASWTPAAIVFALVSLATAASAANGHWFYDDYMLDEPSARRRAAEGLVALSQCNVCFTSGSAAFDWTRLEPNGARGTRLDVDVQDRTISARVHVDAPAGETGFGRVRLDYGDETWAPWSGIVSDKAFRHSYSRPGSYAVAAWLQMRDGSVRADRAVIAVK
jgi:hypothetical protein